MRPVRCRRLHPKRLHQSAMPLLAATGAEVAYQPGAPSRYRAPLSTSESGFARPAGVRRLDDVVGVGVLLDDRVAVVALDDVLDPGEVVTRHDREPPRVASNALVLGPAEPDELVASEATALADERDPVLRVVGAHRFVDFAVRGLVQRDTRLVTFIHAVSALFLGREFPGAEFGGGEHEPHVHG